MAVKQNNTEANAAPAPVNGNAVGGGGTTGGSMAGVSGGGGVGGTGGINGVGVTGVVGAGGGTKTKKLNSNMDIGVSGSANVESVEPGCSGVGTSAPIKPKLNMKGATKASGNNGGAAGLGNIGGQSSKNTTDIAHILYLIELVELKQQHIAFGHDIVKIYHHLLSELARVQIPRQTPKELKRFKEDIVKVGAFFSKVHEKRLYLFYLRVVCQLITQDDGEEPSCAIAIIFQLFSSEMVFEAVQSMLDHKIPDQNIRKTVRLLSEWLRMCNFCQNLNLWIIAILTGLQDQQKHALFRDIALENIEPLFTSLILPVLRPKIYPIVYHMLSSIDQTPTVFHKILPKFPRVITCLKQQSNSLEDYAEETKKILQKLVDLTKSLMVRFHGYDDLYEAVEFAIKDIPYSYGLPSYGNSAKSADDSNVGAEVIPHDSNAKVGLVNLGNTCYMNSVLQALAMTKEFSREILLSQSKSPLLIKMQQQIALMLYSTRFELTPSRVLNATRPPGFSPGLQQDSSEYLGYLLETLHEQETLFYKKQATETALAVKEATETQAAIADSEPAEPIAKTAKQADKDNACASSGEGATAYFNTTQMLEPTTNENPTNTTSNSSTTTTTTITTTTEADSSTNAQNSASSTSNVCKDKAVASTTIEKTFTGKLATTYECLTCGWKSRIVDGFRDLQLSFPEVKNDCASNYSVQDLIDYYCSPEKLYGDNQYFCERCKKLSDAERYINVISAPKNLILTLKHFKYDQKYHTRAKLMHKVFHDEKVSVKVCAADTLEEMASVHYDLYAGVVHSGFSMDSGHYYTYAADVTNKWFKFNDNVVTPSKSEELHNLTPPNTPYILFYQMGARSNEAASFEGSTTKVVKVDVPSPLMLEELSLELRNYIDHDNYVFAEEVKERIFKSGGRAALQNAMAAKRGDGGRGGGGGRGGDYDDDNDSDQPPPTSGCGGNALDINVNRFVY